MNQRLGGYYVPCSLGRAPLPSPASLLPALMSSAPSPAEAALPSAVHATLRRHIPGVLRGSQRERRGEANVSVSVGAVATGGTYHAACFLRTPSSSGCACALSPTPPSVLGDANTMSPITFPHVIYVPLVTRARTTTRKERRPAVTAVIRYSSSAIACSTDVDSNSNERHT